MKILSFIVNRANYGRLKPVLDALKEDSYFELVICCTGTTVEESYGNTFQVIERDGHNVQYKEKIEEGDRDLPSMALTASNAIRMATKVILKEKPEVTLLIGDRYETLGIAIASGFLNVPITHIQGGELSGSIDENIRHSISKLSHLHFTATQRCMDILLRLGENKDYVFNVGCPSGDIILNKSQSLKTRHFDALQAKINFELVKYILVVYHPTTTEVEFEKERVNVLINAVLELNLKTVWLTPNSDAGSLLIDEALRSINNSNISLITSLPPDEYIELMRNSQLCLGNSSSFIRDSGFLGVPVVLIGNRQRNREHSHNLMHSRFTAKSIIAACKSQLIHGLYSKSELYGSGNSAFQIITILKQLNLSIIKDFNFYS